MHSHVTRGNPATELVIGQDRGRTVLAIRGDLDMATVTDVRELILRAMTHVTGPIFVDLSDVTSCDAEGLAVLIHVRRRARLLGLAFSLVSPPDQMRQIMQSTGLWRPFVILTAIPGTAIPGTAIRRKASIHKASIPVPGADLNSGQPAA